MSRGSVPGKYVTLNGVTHTLLEWSRETGIPLSTLYRRYDRGWAPERILKVTGCHVNRKPLKVPSCGAKSIKDCFECTLPDCTAPALIKLEGEHV